ncbi:MAG: TlpA family protein disulfide reductase [Limnohabitans sp.]|jgi:thiol-disulfide isomerase/thioredoxin|uniref:TlpA family protein disulfide reductase n=1 Tax=Limnohabitans sp. TaxID=1907725 RepID=UPI0025ECC21E|nr:TlpA disulfide reductase family protein [Limnohabitans sp.]MCO4089404.1 TlpA family protein disulfide reductase [Limnohabitans sp.]
MKDNAGMTTSSHDPGRRNLLLGAGAAATVAGVGLALRRFEPEELNDVVSHSFWEQQFETTGGGSLSMTQFKGQRLLLNFWATWCPPCIEELPMIDAFWRENNRIGYQVLALAIDQPSAVRRFLARHPLAFPVGLAGLEGTSLAKSLGNTVGGLPFTVFFRPDGSIWRQKMGQITAEDLTQWRQSAT